ncbi:aldo/keto reductase family protein [Qaidamihabitans albus]|uniref:aldo/keto reductase family protein n=1 Tax=Qaidamihabitans albus TaxID=2795733 RepID=UPI0022A818A1|nr:aldo/keto reductase family protein [Qaidamihabitans albus]
MLYRKLGRWGVKLSAVGLGSWLTYGGSAADETSRRCIEQAYEHGINFFDTANEYQGGEAERALGRALDRMPRERLVVASKVCLPVGDGPLDRGLSRKHVTAQLDASLRRLNMDYVDLYQCHRFDPDTPLDETIRTMDDLIRVGKIHYWGVSEWAADQIEAAMALCEAHGWSPPISDQPQYSLLWRGIEPEVLPTCRRLGMGVIAWSPLAMGVLTGKYSDASDAPVGTRGQGSAGHFLDRYLRRPDVLPAVGRFRDLAESTGITAAQLALAWCIRQPGLTTAIVGASNTGQLAENVAAVELQIEDEVFDVAEKVLKSAVVG